jgi:hypothetical protein
MGLELLQGAFHLLQRGVHGVHHGAQALLALVEDLAGHLQEGVLAVAQRIRGERLERGLQLALGAGALEVHVAARLQGGHVRLQGGAAAAPQGEAGGGPQEQHGDQEQRPLPHRSYVEAGETGVATGTLGSGRTETGWAVTSFEFR